MSKKLYLLGSGFSKSCGLPIASNLLDEIVKFENPNRKNILNQGLEKYKSERKNDKIGIEELLTFAIEKKDKILWDIAIDGICRLLQFKKPEIPIHIRNFINNHIEKGDVIITFNWDLVLEIAFYNLNRFNELGYSDYKKDNERIYFLKLHGSLNWCDESILINQRNLSYFPPPFLDIEKLQVFYWLMDILFYMNPIQNAPVTAVFPRPLIIPPIQEFIHRYKILKLNWILAKQALENSKEIIIIGYSLPKYDKFTFQLLRETIGKEGKNNTSMIGLVSKDENAKLRIEECLERTVDFLNILFEDSNYAK